MEQTDERLRRWRLILGEEDGTGCKLSGQDIGLDKSLEALYGDSSSSGRGGLGNSRQGGLGNSAPKVARWLGDIRTYFPSSVVKVMQKDAIERLDLKNLLLEPEMMDSIEPDISMAATLLELKDIMPAKAKETARIVVTRVVEELEKKLANHLRQAVMGSLNKASRNRRPRHKEIDWNRTIRANLKNYQTEYKTIIPEVRLGYNRKRSSLRDIILCVDQSGSMGTSVVYSGVFGAVLASLSSVNTRMVVFDTVVADLSDNLQDPVDLLFGVQLGGGTDINLALGYCQSLIRRPEETILILISDLYEGGNQKEMLKKVATIAASGVQFIALLALNDEGAPVYDKNTAGIMASFGVPSFACTPDIFPSLMAAAINKQNITQWAAANDIVTSRIKSPSETD
jgi:Mg-chelatase subunit ChlD